MKFWAVDEAEIRMSIESTAEPRNWNMEPSADEEIDRTIAKINGRANCPPVVKNSKTLEF